MMKNSELFFIYFFGSTQNIPRNTRIKTTNMSKEDSHRDHVIDGILMSDHPKISKAVRRLRRVKEAVATGEVDCPWK